MTRKAKPRAGAVEDVPRLHQNDWGVWHWKPEKKLRQTFPGRSLGKDAAAARIEAKRLNAEVAAWQKAGDQAAPPRPRRRNGPLTVGQAISAWRYGENGQGSDDWQDKRERTRRQWGFYLKAIEAEFGDEAAGQLSRGRVKRWLDPLKRRAPGTARSYNSCARSLYAWLIATELVPRMENPFGAPKLGKGKRRQRLFTFEDVRHIVRVADGKISAEGARGWRPRPSVGTALVLAFGCVQRISDVIELGFEHLHEQQDGSTRLIFEQSKSKTVGQNFELEPGVKIDMRLPPLVAARLTAAPPPRTQAGAGRLVVNEKTGKPYTDRQIGQAMRSVLARAIACDPKRWKHLAGLQLRDGRRSGFVHLRRLGMTVEDIVNLSGHTLQDGYAIVEHYMPRTTEEADRVAAMMTGEL